MRRISASSSASLATAAPLDAAGPGRRRTALGQLVGQIQRRQHGDALARLDLAGIADGGHFLVDRADRGAQQAFAAFRAAEHVEQYAEV